MTHDEAKALVVSLAGERADIDSLLESSAGKDEGGNTVMRPYFVAALLEVSKRQIVSAEGVTWESIKDRIQGLLLLQSLEDKPLTVPEGFEANICSLIPCNDSERVPVPYGSVVRTERVF